MEKLTLLFDATILINFFRKNGSRSGIFFCSYNLLKQFQIQHQFNIILYVNNHVTKGILGLNKDFACFSYLVKHRKFLSGRNSTNKNKEFFESIHAYFSATSFIPNEIKEQRHIRCFTLLHDTIPLVFPQYYSHSASKWETRKFSSLDMQTYYFCNSEQTKRDYLKYCHDKIDEKKCVTTYIASSQVFKPIRGQGNTNIFVNHHRIPITKRKYLFSFCTLEPRKNLFFTLNCFIKFIRKHQIDDLYFYLGGGHWRSFIGQFEQDLKGFGAYRNKIIYLGYIADRDVNIFYSNSLFFTYLSQYEGFGMPPLEAMLAGTPVITSNNSSLPEVVGDAAIMIEYNNEEQCIKAFEDLYFNEALRKKYIEKGIERAKFFSWEKTVRCMTETITKVCENETNSRITYYVK
ncbi:MAG: glycosyltransferase family 4 protein [Prevotella sp.]|jgi:glycosyltransferase involved in cell wall biosynthesis|nr:glycosyltransferase family 4 protein [Prevotella sp.]